MTFDPSAYPAPVAELLEIPWTYSLTPNKPVAAARQRLKALDGAALLSGQTVNDPSMADACLAGLWLLYDFLDESHEISQSLHHSTGSYWHGIMHRREPDYSNAKYWFGNAGQHAVFDSLASRAREIAVSYGALNEARQVTENSDWDPFQFVDWCQTAASRGGDLEEFCRLVAIAEWQLLFDHCYHQALAS